MSFFHPLKKYLKHWLVAVGKHSLHEPFIFNLYENVIQKSAASESEVSKTAHIETLRSTYKSKTEKINLSLLGAPSRQGDRSLYQIAYQGSTSPFRARMLRRLILHYNFKNVLELGTSLGLTSMYLATSNNVTLTTIEGDEFLAAKARYNFASLNMNNIHLVEGDLDILLSKTLDKMSSVDFVYFDANHQYQTTLNYFNCCLQKKHLQSVFVFDDIHWSEEMSSAWEYIKNHPSVTMSIDFYSMGWIFFRPFRNKYHYNLLIKNH